MASAKSIRRPRFRGHCRGASLRSRTIAAKLIESDIINDLAPADAAERHELDRPGRILVELVVEERQPQERRGPERLHRSGRRDAWEYSLIDANWDQMQTGNIDEVLAHARAKKVAPLLWYNSGGPHNDVTEAPRDRMHTRDVRRAEFAKLQKLGRQRHQGGLLAQRQARPHPAVSRRSSRTRPTSRSR